PSRRRSGRARCHDPERRGARERGPGKKSQRVTDPDTVAMPTAVALEGVSAHEVRIENIRTIGQMYNIFPRAESARPIAASLRRRLEPLVARHDRFGGREELLGAL